MGKYLRDIVLSCGREIDPEFSFKLETNFLQILYLDCLPQTRTDGIGKVIIEACRSLPIEPPRSPRAGQQMELENMVDVLRLNALFDFATYFSASKEIRKKIALDFLQGGLLRVAKIRGWETSTFHDAYKAVLATDFVSYRPWSKPVTSPDRRFKAQVWCNYDSDGAELFLLVFHRKKVISKKHVLTVDPGDVWIRGAIGKLHWLTANTVELGPRESKKSWEAQYEPVQVVASVDQN